MIKPTPGRIVHYFRNYSHGLPEQPLAAIVTDVLSDRLINVHVFSKDGSDDGTIVRVPLLQDDDVPPKCGYAAWMDYQKGQAAKTEALEQKLAERT